MRWIGALCVAGLVGIGIVPACGGDDGSVFGDGDASAGDDGSGIDASGPILIGRDGGNADGGAATCPGARTCQQLGVACGPAGDGCGGILQCGTCKAPATCGGGGMPSKCGGTMGGCVPKTCAQIGASCGQQGDGCGNVIDCGGCPQGQSCGGAGTPNQCGVPGPGDGGAVPCTPRTCAQAGATCGQVADGCGGLTSSCGSCSPPFICGGAGVPNQCGDANLDGGAGACVNLCPKIPKCDGSAGTTISGTVVAPTPAQYGNPDPLYGALVYIPNSASGALDPFPNGVACDQCGAQASGQPLVSATTGPDGKFVLKNAPAGSNIPLVIQLGRWRREVFITTVNPCVDNPLPTALTRLPRREHEGTPYDNIPLTAMVTGNVDALECVLRKIGIDDTEFGNPTSPAWNAGAPRIQFYQSNPATNGAGGAIINGSTPKESALWSSADTMKQYDQILLACEGGEDPEAAAQLANAQTYTNAGGRLYATHYSYTWIDTNAPWSTTANWTNPNTGNNPPSPVTAFVNQTFAKGQAFAQWLVYAGASATPGQVPISVSRHDFFAPIQNGAEEWLYAKQPDPDTPLHYTFNTPVGAPAAQQCGRVLYSDFHVTNAQTLNVVYPSECTAGPMTAQEKVLEFMIFDLASCIQAAPPPPPPSCTPLTCAQQGIQCGPAGDGCGNVIQCGSCPSGQVCGGGGPSKCGGGTCKPETCAQLGISCGPAGDGCGDLLQCGTCTPPMTCGGGGVGGQCGTGPCKPLTCAQQNANCGFVGDGCGGLLDCGTCAAPLTCGGGGTPNQCGGGTR